MSYRTEEKQIQWKLRRIRGIVLTVVLLLVVAVCIFSAIVPPETWKYYFYLPTVSVREEGDLRMHFLDVGQGDCTIVELPDGKCMMVDGGNGEEQNTTAIMRYLKSLQIGHIDYLVLTHVDGDHCGGLDVVMKYHSVGTVYYPDEENVAINREYAEFYQALTGVSAEKPFNRRGETIISTDTRYPYEVVWLWPYGKDNQGGGSWTGNGKSAVLYIEYAGKKALLMGDAPKEVAEQLYAQSNHGLLCGKNLADLDVYKVSHHGSADGVAEDLLALARPKYAVISCGKDNLYGHPSVATLTALSEVGSAVYRTDDKGSILFTWRQDGTQAIKTTIG